MPGSETTIRPDPDSPGDRNPWRPPLIEILKTTDPTVIAAARAYLQGEAIEFFLLDVHMSGLYGGALGFIPQRLMVADEDAARARMILRPLGFELSPPPEDD